MKKNSGTKASPLQVYFGFFILAAMWAFSGFDLYDCVVSHKENVVFEGILFLLLSGTMGFVLFDAYRYHCGGD